MLKKIFPIALVAILMAFIGCSKGDDITPSPSPSPSPDNTPTISVSNIQVSSSTIKSENSEKELSFTFQGEGGSASFSIYGSGDWTLSAVNSNADSWVSVSPKSGKKGNTSIKVEVQKNESYDDRTAVFEASCGTAKKTIQVNQKAAGAILLSTNSIEVGKDGETVSFELQHSIDYAIHIEDCSEWVTQTSTRALVTDMLTFDVAANTTGKSRVGKIFITSSLGKETIRIYQIGSANDLVVSEHSPMIGAKGGELEIVTQKTSALEVIIPDSWVKQETTRSVSTNKYIFTVEENSREVARSTDIIFKRTDKNQSDTVTVTQMEKGAFVLAEMNYRFNCLGGTFKIEKAYDEPITVTVMTDTPGFIYLESEQVAKETGIYKFIVTENKDKERKVALVVVNADSKPDQKQYIPVELDGSGGSMPALEMLTSLPRESITQINYYTKSDKKTSQMVDNGTVIYSETVGTTLNVYTPADEFVVEACYGYFEGCTALKSLDLRSWNTSSCDNMGRMFMDCRSLQQLNVSSFDTSKVTTFEYMFWNCLTLKTLDLSNFRTPELNDIDNMFSGCTGVMNLESLDLSMFNVSHVTCFKSAFHLCANLKSLNLKGWNIPANVNVHTMMFTVGDLQECKVYTSLSSAEMLIESNASCGNGIEWILDNGAQFYRSTDYSMDGQVTLLQKASEGQGINVVFLCDAYSDRNITNGRYRNVVSSKVNELFSEEPLKSLKNFFNIYEVAVVSENEHYYKGSKSAFDATNTTPVMFDSDKLKKYVLKAVDEKQLDATTVVLLLNANTEVGSADLFPPDSYDSKTDYASGFGIAACGLGLGDGGSVLLHEFGHAFAKLDEEYVQDGGAISAASIKDKQKMAEMGWWSNVDFTSDLGKIKWASYVNDSRYASQHIGAYEGAATYAIGVWRPTETSIMNNDYDGYNAPSRETFYRRIHKLALGSSWTFDIEEFKKWDLEHSTPSTRSVAPKRSIQKRVSDIRVH